MKEPVEYLLGLINSRAMSYWFYHKFGKLQRGIFPQFKVNELASFPIPAHVEPVLKAKICELVKKILHATNIGDDSTCGALDKQIDALVYEAYGLSKDEIAIIEDIHAQ